MKLLLPLSSVSNRAAAVLVILFVMVATSFTTTTEAFTSIAPQLRTASSSSPASSSSSFVLPMVAVPRLALPEVVTAQLETFQLQNPNTMSDEDYNSYAGAAILGTFVFFLLPGALVTDLLTPLSAILGGVLPNFSVSALVGGGTAIYLSLRSDELGTTVRKYGAQFLTTVGLPTVRYELPSQITDVMEQQLDLQNPNTLSEEDYQGYAGAAVAGTLVFFLVPGALLTGELTNLVDFGATVVQDFLLSAVIGGGIAIYAALRQDGISTTVNTAGAKFLAAIDTVVSSVAKDGSPEKLAAEASEPEVSEPESTSE